VPGVDLYWLPLGAGGSVVRLNGRAFEAVRAVRNRRRPLDIYHAALSIELPEGSYAVEIAPIPARGTADRGVVGNGAVGSALAGRFRIFRYELRCWLDGGIPDIAEAVASPVRVVEGETEARHMRDLLREVPMPVWGRDELDTGEMWTSNSVVSWVLCRAGIDMSTIRPPKGGCAPGWDAGLITAYRRNANPPRGSLG
jgi:hypothetical protein